MNRTPPAERPETHHLRTRSRGATTDLGRRGLATALDHGDELLVECRAADADRLERAFGARLDSVAPPWDYDGGESVGYRLPAARARDSVETLVDADPPLVSLAVRADGATIYETTGRPSRHVGAVTVPPAGDRYERALRTQADDHAGVLCPIARLAEWTDGDRWYEIAGGQFHVYGEDVSGTDWATRQQFVTGASHDVVAIRRLHVDTEARRIEFEWADPDPMSTFERVWDATVGRVLPDPPAELQFENPAAFETAANGFLEVLGRERRVRVDGDDGRR